MNVRTYTATVHMEAGLYVANCFEIGTVGKGATIEEALNNLKTITETHLYQISGTDKTPVSFRSFVSEAAR